MIAPRAEKLRQSPPAQLNIALAVQLLLATVQGVIIIALLGTPGTLGGALIVGATLICPALSVGKSWLLWRHEIQQGQA